MVRLPQAAVERAEEMEPTASDARLWAFRQQLKQQRPAPESWVLKAERVP